jgi:outer membrane protein assembly factor BamB
VKLSCTLALLSVTLLIAYCGAEDWPLVRANVSGTAVAASKLPDQLEELWTYKAVEPAGFDATAVVAAGIIYVGDSEGTIHAIKLTDGKMVWTKSFEDGGSITAGGAVDRGKLHVADMNGIVRCLSVSDGSEVWHAKVESEVHAGPILHEGKILVTCEAGTLSCFDAVTGDKKWDDFKIDAPLRCSPTIANGRVMLAGCDSLLHAINVSDGSEAFTVPIDGPTGATAAMRDDRVYFGTEGGTFYGIDVRTTGGQVPAVLWSFRDPRRGQPIRSAAAVTEDLVVFGGQGKAVFALDPKSGQPKWTLPTRSRVDSSPVIAGERVVAATSAGKLYLLDATNNGEPIWEADLGGGFTASPAVVDGRVIIGNTDGTLYCFGAKSSTTEGTESTEKQRH